MEYINFWSGFGLGFLCFASLGYAIYKDAESNSDKIIEDILQDIAINEKPEIKLATKKLHHGGVVSLIYVCCGINGNGYGNTPAKAYQNYKSMCYNKDTD